MNTGQPPMYKWQDLPWKRIERQVFKLQKRIYQAALRGDRQTIHKLQKLLINSWSARCLAVRRVAQDNRGKRTAGIDGVKHLSPRQRLELAQTLTLSQTARPVRRIWIPKPGKQEKRPLGIPVMRDRAEQALVLLALEPEWEARFEPNSYGFRPGRSAHDAIEAIFQAICQKPKYVLDADIAQCFDRIDHQALLDKLDTFPTLRRAIRAWLKAGVMEGETLFPAKQRGTPQGGVISPLLANIALHGLEEAVAEVHPKARVVRYADDLVVLHEDLAVIHQMKAVVSEWLAPMGLELKPSKTRIVHTLYEHNGQVGFDFLGFQVRQFATGKNRSGKQSYPPYAPLGFKTIIQPSKDACIRHYRKITHLVKIHLSLSQEQLIAKLNSLIRGWTRYYSTVSSKNAFDRLIALTFYRLWHWAKRRHQNKSSAWIANKYWHRDQGSWNFATPEGVSLYLHSHTPIWRHTKVRGTKSPYDGDWVYWARRLARYPALPTRVVNLLKRQDGKCASCGLVFTMEDWTEVDHLVPTSMGGRDCYANWQLLHAHCHHQKTAQDRRIKQSVALVTGAG
jgi:RNA-directed DNA polymerase